MSALATVTRKTFKANLLQKLIFRLDILCYIADADIENLKYLHS